MLLALVAAVAAVSSPGLAGAAAAQETDSGSRDGRYFDPVFDEMTVTEDIVYGSAVFSDGLRDDLKLDLYEPLGDTAETRPVIVLLHGGFFVIGNHKEDTWGAGPGVARTFTDLGYVVASVQYRLRPELPMIPPDLATEDQLAMYEAASLDAHDDVAAAIGWLRDHAAERRIDPDAIVPYGFSAGGVIAWHMAWFPGSSARPDPVGVPAAVSVAGAPYETSVITGEPLAAPSPGEAPVLAYHGTADEIIAYEFAAGPCGRAAAAGVRCDLVTFDGLGHPALDNAFVDELTASVDITTSFLAEEVLIPLGYVDAVPDPAGPPPSTPAAPPTAPPAIDLTPPSASQDGPPGAAPPIARPARPVIAHPTYTG